LDPADSKYCRLRISPHCINTIWELKRYRWKTYTNKKLAFERNAYEEPNKKDDHACDAIRYVIMNQPDPSAENPHNSDTQLDIYMQELQRKAQEWGAPYMVDDPNDRFLDRTTNPFIGAQDSPTGTEWTYDEHMGDLL
jgi:hypothetical protein